MGKADFYKTLGVGRNANDRELKTAFRNMAMKYHPDKNQNNPEAEKKFREASEAYEVLRDPKKRALYDQYGHAAFENGGPSPHNSGGFSSTMNSGSVFADIFEDIFGASSGSVWGNKRTSSTREPGADLRYNVDISLEEAFSGKNMQVRIPNIIKCNTCDGSGAKPGTSPKTCNICNGSGTIFTTTQSIFSIERTCNNCRGSGQIISNPCAKCHGQGRVEEEQLISFDIPQGADDGTRIRLSGRGEAGLNGGNAGDLYVFISVKKHEFFRRDGANLYCIVPISMITATIGGKFDVATLDATQSRVTVPEGTQTGKQFRLKGKGMPILNSSRRGDLYVQIQVETPQKLNSRQREILEEFERISSKDNNPQSIGFFSKMKDFFETLGG